MMTDAPTPVPPSVPHASDPIRFEGRYFGDRRLSPWKVLQDWEVTPALVEVPGEAYRRLLSASVRLPVLHLRARAGTRPGTNDHFVRRVLAHPAVPNPFCWELRTAAARTGQPASMIDPAEVLARLDVPVPSVAVDDGPAWLDGLLVLLDLGLSGPAAPVLAPWRQGPGPGLVARAVPVETLATAPPAQVARLLHALPRPDRLALLQRRAVASAPAVGAPEPTPRRAGRSPGAAQGR